MNGISAGFTLFASIGVCALPRRLAAVPLLLGASYVTRVAEIEIGPAHLTVMRILVLIGLCRVLVKGERLANGLNRVDRLVMLWAGWLIVSSVFHTSDAWMFRAGIVWSDLGCYFLFRTLIVDSDDVRRIFKVLCLVLLPVAVLMLWEKSAGQNVFAVLGGASEVDVRDGHARARGPFAHAILAGTVGATCLPMALYFWKSRAGYCVLGLLAGGGIVFASTSSSPVMMMVFMLTGLLLWRVRGRLGMIRLLVGGAVIVLDVMMKDPVYFLMARIDVTGGSTGWHRARLIQSAIEHLDEWWLGGTDYTRHWLSTGIPANLMHTDITNHLLAMGVMGGLALMMIFVTVVFSAFSMVGRALLQSRDRAKNEAFLIWTLGTLLFGHVMNFMSISLFDQSAVFFYLILAGIGAVEGTRQRVLICRKRSAIEVGGRTVGGM